MVQAFSNDLLARLQPDDQQHVLHAAERVRIPSGKVIFDSDAAVRSVYFIEGGLATLSGSGRAIRPIDVCMVGKEGFLGSPLVLGLDSSPYRTVMRVEGPAYRLDEEHLAPVLAKVPGLRTLMLRFVHFSMVQIAQSAASNATHTVGQRLARRLLMMQDRIGGNVILSTHEMLAEAMGVRRPGVGEAMKILERAGALHQGHGRILVMSRSKLIEASCGCYEVVRGEDDGATPKRRREVGGRSSGVGA